MILVEKLKCVLRSKTVFLVIVCLIASTLSVYYASNNFTVTRFEPTNAPIEQRYFLQQGTITPDIDLLELLCELILSEKTSIKVAAFCLSSRPIARALGLAATQNGIPVTIVIDPSSLKYTSKFFSKELPIDHDNIHFYIYQIDSQGCMHHKFMLFESTLDNRSLVFEGTLNFSYSALKYNNETVRITENYREFQLFGQAFDEIKRNALHIKGIKIFDNKKEGFITTDPLSYYDLYYLHTKPLSIPI